MVEMVGEDISGWVEFKAVEIWDRLVDPESWTPREFFKHRDRGESRRSRDYEMHERNGEGQGAR